MADRALDYCIRGYLFREVDKWPEIIDYCKNDVLACDEAMGNINKMAESAENDKKGEQDGGNGIA